MSFKKNFRYFVIILLFFSLSLFISCNNNESISDNNSYSIDENTNNALMGPLEGAIVKVYSLFDLNNSIEETETGALGSFEVTLNGIDDEDLLLVSITGGNDIDVDDDGIKDETPTVNKGTIHGFANANNLKTGKVKITLLSEIVYQHTKHLIGQIHTDDFEILINMIESKLKKTNNSKKLIYFDPTSSDDKEILAFDYDQLIKGDNPLNELYYQNEEQKIIERLDELFQSVLNMKDSSFLNATNYVNVSLNPPIEADITSEGASLFYNYDNDSKKLQEFIKKGSNLSFSVTVRNNYKILKWHGCDNVSDDLNTCYLENVQNDKNISPIVVSSEIRMNPNYSIKDITNSHIINESDSYTVTADLNDTNMKTVLNSINIGDVIVSNVEPIFFKKVTAIDKVDDNNFIFETEFIPLEEVVQEGYLSGSSAFATNSNPSTKRTKTQFISRNGKKIPLNSNEKGEYKLYFGKKNQQKSLEVSTVLIEYDQIDGVKIKGSVKINPKFDLDMDWSLFGGLEYLRIAPGFKITPGIELVIEKELAGFGGTQNDKYLGSISHTQIFPVGIIPVSVTEDIKLYVGAEGSVKGVITVGAEVSIDQTYILTWSKKSGLHFNPVFNQTTGSLKLPEIKVEGEAGAYVKVEPGIRVYIIGVGVANKIGIYGQLGAKTGSMINFTGNDVDVDVAKVYYELFLKYQPQFTLSVPAVFANNEFVKGLKHDFESKFPPIAEIKYTLAKKEFGALDQVIPLKPGELKVIGYNYTEDFKNNQIVNESITYQLENIGQQDLYWSASLHGELLEGINIFPKSGKLAPNDKTDILVDIGLNDLSTIIGENKSVLCFYSSDEQIIEWHSPMVIPDNYDDLILPKFSYSIALNVHPVLDPLNNAILLTDGDSYKKITIQYDEPTNDVDGYIIYKADYNSEDNYCYENYNRFAKVNDKTQNKYSFLLETSINSLDINKKMDIGHSYCFNMASFKEINNFYSESPFMQTDLILNVPNYATLKSNITDQNNNAIENVMIYLTSLSDNTITDGLGNYTFDQLLPGNYKVIVEAEGYIRVEGDVTLESGEIKIFERQLVVSEDLEDIEGTVKGKVQNALDGSGVPNATISIRKGINITSGEFIKTITTDSNGYYSTILVTGGYTFSIEAENYAVTHPTVYSFGNSVTTKDLTLSPILSVGNMRIVLSWGMNPLDLDSHLVKKVNGSQEYHIYYSDQSGTNGDNLDHDDVESYGPETVTIENVDPGADYYYFVKQFSDDSNLKSSSAKVEVYYGNSHFIYNVPNEDGIYWEVFEIQNGNIIPCTSNCIVDDLDFIETRNFKRKKDSLPAF